MKKYLFFIILIFVSNIFMLSGQSYFRSNSIGMVFEEIPFFRIDEFKWVLHIQVDGPLETRILYFKENIAKKTEYLKKDESLYISEYTGNELFRKEEQKNGYIIKEEFFLNNNLLNEYHYEWDDRRLLKTTYLENKKIVYEDLFVLQDNGKIIQVRRMYSSGSLSTSGFSQIYKSSSQEWYATDKEFILYKYKDGRIEQVENWKNGVLNITTIHNYTENKEIIVETDLLTGYSKEKIFDLDKKILSEISWNGNIVEKITYIYNNELLIQKDLSSSGLREKYLFEYNSEGVLITERIYSDGMLKREILYKKGKKEVEKIYKNNSLLLVVHYEDNDIIRREYLK